MSLNDLFQSIHRFSNLKARLEPLALNHSEALSDLGLDESIWAMGTKHVSDEDEMVAYVDDAVAERRAGISYPFAIIDVGTGIIAGCTRLFNFSWEHKRVEIGHTWIGKDFQGTGLNRAVKFELLRFCFEHLGMIRVELKTDSRNVASRKALLKIGLSEEGILRSDTINWDGYRRDTVYFSMLESEWPEIRQQVFRDFLEDAVS